MIPTEDSVFHLDFAVHRSSSGKWSHSSSYETLARALRYIAPVAVALAGMLRSTRRTLSTLLGLLLAPLAFPILNSWPQLHLCNMIFRYPQVTPRLEFSLAL